MRKDTFLVRVDKETHHKLKKVSDESGLTMASIVEDLVNKSGKPVNIPTKVVNIPSAEFCVNCQNKITEVKETVKINQDKSRNGKSGTWAWVLLGVLVIGYIAYEEHKVKEERRKLLINALKQGLKGG